MYEIVFASRFIQQLYEDTHGSTRRTPSVEPALEPCATTQRGRCGGPTRRTLRLARPLAAVLGALALAVIAVAR